MIWLKISMDIYQIIELWKGLSPRLARVISSQELPEVKHANEKESDESSEDETVSSIESHLEESNF